MKGQRKLCSVGVATVRKESSRHVQETFAGRDSILCVLSCSVASPCVRRFADAWTLQQRKPVNDQHCAILIVEDDEKLQDMVRTILSRQATSIDVASDGEEAIEKLESGRYDIVILDLMLPKKNGLIVAEAVAALAHKPRLIVLSVISRYLSDRFPAGTLVLQKPFEIDKLAETVRGICAELKTPSAG